MESDDMEDIRGEPVWKVEDRDRGMMDLHRNIVVRNVSEITILSNNKKGSGNCCHRFV